MCFGKDAKISITDTDRYGRAVAIVNCNGINVNRAQVESGMAWVYTKYNNDQSMVAAESSARAARRGLWIDPAPVAPWDYRRSK